MFRVIACFFIISFSTVFAEKSFKPFTGKVLGNKVRVRTGADLESHIIRQVGKSDLLLVVGEENDFWAVKPPQNTKAYVYRTYILDGVVEANRVNVRLEPNIEAPIVGQLQMGEKVQGHPSRVNPKWIEINAPDEMRFYISKEYVGFAGGPEYLSLMVRKREDAKKELSEAYALLDSEMKKPFQEMKPSRVIQRFEKVIEKYSDFDAIANQAKEGLSILQQGYTKRKIAFLENKVDNKSVPEIHFPKYDADSDFKKNDNLSPKMRFWEEVEEGLYLSWKTFNIDKKIEDFYYEQEVNASMIAGVVESYDNMVKNLPGDFLLKKGDNPFCFLYSTNIDLQKYVGQNVQLVVSPRPNNNFAFPAYFVLAVED